MNFLNSKQTVVCFNVRFINIAALDKYAIAVSELGTDYNRPLDIGHSTRLPTRAGVHTSTVISTPRVAFESRPQECNLIEKEIEKLKLDWGARCGSITTGGLWSPEERCAHINCLELLVASLVVKTFAKDKENLSI